MLKAQCIKNGKYVAIKCMKNNFDSLDQVSTECQHLQQWGIWVACCIVSTVSNATHQQGADFVAATQPSISGAKVLVTGSRYAAQAEA